MNKRISYIDIARAFAILFIVLGHTLVHSEHCSAIFKFLYSFHVVMFFILSGYTFKIKDNQSFFEFLKNKIIRIMIPYFIWSLLFLIPYILFGSNVSNDLDINSTFDLKQLLFNIIYGIGSESALKQNSSLWFLPALFSMEVIYYYIIRFVDKNNKFRVPVLIGSIVVGYASSYLIHFYMPWGINTVLNLGCFFLLGYLIKNSKIDDFISNLYYTIVFIIIGCVACYFNNTVQCIDYEYGNYSLALLSGFCLSMVFINISKYINSNKVLEYIGRNTMGILIFHKLIILIFQTKMGIISQLLSNSNIYLEVTLSLVIVVLSVLTSLVATIIVRRTIPIFIGEKKFFHRYIEKKIL